ncbi:F-box domain-containing protein [Favolaschia claudopus]|uniref:F-box domain-containing protein n=1 Tax=Favolaschia claudopus TaxID=2862362 RepID=A0AAW0B8Q2_9AGAR
MSDTALPDEIISEILSPALKVSDDVFSDTSEVSPFANFSVSTSAYLLVCKSWLRVATPPLYHTVIIRSKAQAKALSLALSKNKQLGRFIKKLRVEGGYGEPMHVIMRCAPNITDIFLSLEIYSSDSTSGLCKGLRLINPTRLILRDVHDKPLENKSLSQLLDAMYELIPKQWDHLRVFHCPYVNATEHALVAILPLIKSKRLRTLFVPNIDAVAWSYVVFEDSPLEVIHIDNFDAKDDSLDDPLFDKYPALRDLVKFPADASFGGDTFPVIAPASNPLFVPLENTPAAAQDAIWDRVLYFAMANRKHGADDLPRAALLTVSKTFHRVGLPHYCADMILRHSTDVKKLGSIVLKYGWLGPKLRTLVFDYLESLLDCDYDSEDGSRGWALKLLSRTSGLVRFGPAIEPNPSHTGCFVFGATISWDGFEALAKCAGANLQEFSTRVASRRKPRISSTVFNDFTALRTLRWICHAEFTDIRAASVDALANLEELWITEEADGSVLSVLSRMKLQSLRRFFHVTRYTSCIEFLRAHGSKLTEVGILAQELSTPGFDVYSLCPHLHTIAFIVESGAKHVPAIKDILPRQTAPSLSKIIMEPPELMTPLHKDKERIAAWDIFFANFQSKKLPNLREIEFKCFTWPTTERDIAKNCWVRWAEGLVSQNINLLDRTGTKWRSRLK